MSGMGASMAAMHAAQMKAMQPVKDGAKFDPSSYGSLDDQGLLEASREFVSKELSLFEPVRRSDIIGIDHHLIEVDQIADRLREFAMLSKAGADMDCGAVFYGLPGTGKTLCARYLAMSSEAIFVNVAFFPRKNGAWMAHDVSRLFRVGRETVEETGRPVIFFWDEFDGFAKINDQSTSDAREAVSALKTELSGITGKALGVFIIATMNSAPGGELDPALFRAGRIGRRLRFEKPHRQARRDLMRYYLLRISHGKCAKKEAWFNTLSYLLGANTMPSDIEEIANEIWANVVMRARVEGKTPYIRMEDPIPALMRRYAGEPTNFVRTEEARQHIALRLAARALVARTQGLSVQLMTCFVRGYEKVDMLVESDETGVPVVINQKDEIALMFAGSTVEDLLGLPASIASSEEKVQATSLAQRYVERYGGNEVTISMSGISAARERQDISPYLSNGLFEYSTRVIEKLITEQEGVARQILEAYGAEHIRSLAETLLAQEYLLQQQIDKFVQVKHRVTQQIEISKDEGLLPGFYL